MALLLVAIRFLTSLLNTANGDVESTPTLIAVSQGVDTFNEITPFADTDASTVTFTIHFNSRVTGLSPSNFMLSSNKSSPNLITLTQAMIAPVTGTGGTSIYGSSFNTSPDPDSAMFSNRWEISHTVNDVDGALVSLQMLNLSNINPEGPATSITGTLPSVIEQPFVATAPTVMNITRNGVTTSLGGPTQQRSWTIQFNQRTTNVDAGDFEVVNASGTVFNGASIISIDSDPSDSTLTNTGDGTTESEIYRITIELPSTGHPTGTTAHLGIKSGNDIEGASGAASAGSTRSIRVPFGNTAGTRENITPDIDDAFTVQSLQIMGITRTLYDHATNDGY